MGWDAHAITKFGNPASRCRRYKKAFQAAAEQLKAEGHIVDVYLSSCGLDVSDCGNMLEKATNCSVYDELGWSPELTKKINDSANWQFDVSLDDQWAYLSAKTFLNLCAKLNLGIKFSF